MRLFYPLLPLAMLVGCTAIPTKTENPKDISAPSFKGLSDADVFPVPLFRSLPIYPKEMFDKKVKGEVLADFIVERDGSVQIVRPVTQTNELFATATVECLRKWKFKPALKGGLPVRFLLRVPMFFTFE